MKYRDTQSFIAFQGSGLHHVRLITRWHWATMPSADFCLITPSVTTTSAIVFHPICFHHLGWLDGGPIYGSAARLIICTIAG